MVRIISGSARGKKLQTPPGEGTRPTADRVREALFNLLRHRIGCPPAGLRVLDLFAGAGTLGLEAASRGADALVLVEQDRKVCRILQANAKAVFPAAQVITAPVAKYLNGAATPFELVFLDPPYAAGAAEDTLAALTRGWLAEGAVVVVEHSSTQTLTAPPGLTGIYSKRYGGTTLSFFQI